MIQYYSFWNLFIFYLYLKKYIKPSILFFTSLTITSIIGFILINIYPSSGRYHVFGKLRKFPYLLCSLGDITIHQIPIIYTFFIDNFKIKYFGEEIIIFLFSYLFINYIRKLDFNKIYQVDNFLFYILTLIITIFILTFSLLII